MSSLPGETKAGERLKRTALRDFGLIPDNDAPLEKYYKLNLSRVSAPVPPLLKYALTLIGLEAYRSSEKVALAA